MTVEEIYSAVYVSTALSPLSDDELRQLHEVAKTRNSAEDITGALLYNGLNFMQLLEGRKAAVSDCLSRISRDHRHSGMAIIRRDTRLHREFEDWDMLYSRVSSEGLKPAEPFADWLARKQVSDNTRLIFASFQSLGM